jgi:hypothetical protein
MSYERQMKLNKMARELNVAARHVAHGVGAGNKAIETAETISPALAEQTKRFFVENLGLRRDVMAIGSYIGQVMWPQFDEEMDDAVQYGYEDASRYPGGGDAAGPPPVGLSGVVRRRGVG